jgi:hypothetical protein
VIALEEAVANSANIEALAHDSGNKKEHQTDAECDDEYQ